MENTNTSLSHIHESLGAKMIPFAGFNMPVQYTGVTLEHLNVREHVGVFDVSHMESLSLGEKVPLNWCKKLPQTMFQNW